MCKIILIIAFLCSKVVYAQEIQSKNDSTLKKYLSVLSNSCSSPISYKFLTSKRLNIEWDKKVISRISLLIATFEKKGDLSDIYDIGFKVVEFDEDSSVKNNIYSYYTSRRKGDLDIFIEYKENKITSEKTIHLKILTNSKIKCKDGGFVLTNFDAIYCKSLVSAFGFEFVLYPWGDELFYITRFQK